MEYDKLQDKKMNATGDERKRFLEMQVDLLLSESPYYDKEDCMIDIEVLDKFYKRGIRCSHWIDEDDSDEDDSVFDDSVGPIEDDLESEVVFFGCEASRSSDDDSDMSKCEISFGIWNDDCQTSSKYDKEVHSIHTGSSEWKVVGRKKRFAKEHKNGVVTYFKNGWGWIESSSEKIFVHNQNIKMKGFRTLTNGQKVTFDIGLGKNGGFQAINVTPVT